MSKEIQILDYILTMPFDKRVKIKDMKETHRVIELYCMTWETEFEIEIGKETKIKVKLNN